MSDYGGDDGAAADYSSSTDHGTTHDYSHHDHVHSHQNHEHSSHNSYSHAYEDLHSSPNSHEPHQDRSSRSQWHRQYSIGALPTYEDAIATATAGSLSYCSPSSPATDHPATAHCRKADNRDKCNHECRHHPRKHNSDHCSLYIYDQQNIFDAQTWNTERESQTEAARESRGLGAPKTRLRASSNEQRYMSKCNICLIASFIIIAVSLLLIPAFLKF